MDYFAELISQLARFWNVNVHVVDPLSSAIPAFDFGLREYLLKEAQEALRALLFLGETKGDTEEEAEPETIRVITDCFRMNYILIHIPSAIETDSVANLAEVLGKEAGVKPQIEKARGVFLIGPYRESEMSMQELHKLQRNLGLPRETSTAVASLYQQCPVIFDADPWHEFIKWTHHQLYPGEKISFSKVPIVWQNSMAGEAQFATAKQVKGSEEEDKDQVFIRGQEIKTAIRNGDFEQALQIDQLSDKYPLPASFTRRQRLESAWETYMHVLRDVGVSRVIRKNLYQIFLAAVEQIKTAEQESAFRKQMLQVCCEASRDFSISKASPVIRTIVEEIENKITEDLSLEKMAAKHRINSSYLSTQFKKEIGVSFLEYVQEERMNFAAHLFLAGEQSVEWVAMQCGFTDVAYFRKLFKKWIGMTPTECKNILQAKGGVMSLAEYETLPIPLKFVVN